MGALLTLCLSTWALSGPEANNMRRTDPQLEQCLVSWIDHPTVPAQEAGELKLLEAREGDSFEAGAVIGRIDDELVQKERDVAVAEWLIAKEEAENDVNIRFAEAAVLVATAAYDMVKAANAQKDRAIPPALVQQRRFEMRKAELSVEQSKKEQTLARLTEEAKAKAKDMAEAKVRRREIRAPISGMVIEVLRQQGEWVQAGEPVLRIARTDKLRVQGVVLASQYSDSEIVNRPVTVEVELTQGRIERFQGKITFANPLVEAGGRYKVSADVPNRQENGVWLLRPGLPARMTIHLNPVAQQDARQPAATQVQTTAPRLN